MSLASVQFSKNWLLYLRAISVGRVSIFRYHRNLGLHFVRTLFNLILLISYYPFHLVYSNSSGGGWAFVWAKCKVLQQWEKKNCYKIWRLIITQVLNWRRAKSQCSGDNLSLGKALTVAADACNRVMINNSQTKVSSLFNQLHWATCCDCRTEASQCLGNVHFTRTRRLVLRYLSSNCHKIHWCSS